MLRMNSVFDKTHRSLLASNCIRIAYHMSNILCIRLLLLPIWSHPSYVGSYSSPQIPLFFNKHQLPQQRRTHYAEKQHQTSSSKLCVNFTITKSLAAFLLGDYNAVNIAKCLYMHRTGDRNRTHTKEAS